MADRQQHIDTLARAMAGVVHRPTSDGGARLPTLEERVARIFDSTDPAVHDALIAALHANADRARVLAAHADNGWLEEDVIEPSEEWDSLDAVLRGEPGRMVGYRRLVSEWEAKP